MPAPLPRWLSLLPQLAVFTPVSAAASLTFPDQSIRADESRTVGFTIGNSAWSPSLRWDNPTLFRSAGTRSRDDLRLGGSGTNRTLVLRPAPGTYGTSRITLSVLDAQGSIQQVTSFQATVTPKAAADHALVPGRGSTTIDLLRNDTPAMPGASRWIEQFTPPSHGTLTPGSFPGTLRYTPHAATPGEDAFSYTVRYSGGESATATCYVRIGDLLPVDAVHTDLGLMFQQGRWEQEIRAELPFGAPNAGGPNNPTVLDFDEALLIVSPLCRTTVPAQVNPAQFAHLGVTPGATVWQLPQSNPGGRLWPGFSTEGSAQNAFASFTPANDPRASAHAPWLRVELVACRMPAGAHFAMSEAGINAPLVWFDTVDGINSTNDSSVGGNPSDTLWITSATHAHMDWWFTAPGHYQLDIRVRALVADGASVYESVSPVNTLHFLVQEQAAAIPPIVLPEIPPSTTNDTAVVEEDSRTHLLPLANDHSSPDRWEELSILATSQPANGQVTIDPSAQSLVYSPLPGFFGADTFSYTVADEHGGTATATVSVRVRPQPLKFLPDHSLRVALQTNPGTTAIIQTSPNLSDWSHLGPPISADDQGNLIAIDPAPHPSRAFYRALLLNQP